MKYDCQGFKAAASVTVALLLAVVSSARASDPAPVVRFSDQVMSLSLETGRPAYRVTFRLHAAVYSVGQGDRALGCLKDSFLRKAPVKIRVDASSLRILDCAR